MVLRQDQLTRPRIRAEITWLICTRRARILVAFRGRVTGLDWYATHMEIAKARKDENAKEFRTFALSRFRDSRGLQINNRQTMRRLAVKL